MRMFGRGGGNRLQERINSVAARQSLAPQPQLQPVSAEDVPPPAPEAEDDDDAYDRVMALLQLSEEARIDPITAAHQARDELILATEQIVTQLAAQHAIRLGGSLRRALATAFVGGLPIRDKEMRAVRAAQPLILFEPAPRESERSGKHYS